ncbi:unnamed protein product [Amoebophrya sp. A25]|nr:unnamed protein product [Amoebophrya sp. A25]|eukprot:GSA25T00027801001.1
MSLGGFGFGFGGSNPNGPDFGGSNNPFFAGSSSSASASGNVKQNSNICNMNNSAGMKRAPPQDSGSDDEQFLQMLKKLNPEKRKKMLQQLGGNDIEEESVVAENDPEEADEASEQAGVPFGAEILAETSVTTARGDQEKTPTLWLLTGATPNRAAVEASHAAAAASQSVGASQPRSEESVAQGRNNGECKETCPLWKVCRQYFEKERSDDPEKEDHTLAQNFIKRLRQFSGLTDQGRPTGYNWMIEYASEVDAERVGYLTDRNVVNKYELGQSHDKYRAGIHWKDYKPHERAGFVRMYCKSKFCTMRKLFLRKIGEKQRRNALNCIFMIVIDGRPFFGEDHKDKCYACLESMEIDFETVAWQVAKVVVTLPKTMVLAGWTSDEWF